MRARRNGSLVTAVGALSGAVGLLAGVGTAGAAVNANSATVTVNSNVQLARLSSVPWGINTRAQDVDLQDSVLPKLLRDAGIRTLRYPGGSLADAYHWENNSISAGAGYSTFPGADFTALMNLAKASHAMPIITVNYGSNASGTGGGTPQEAAAWVKYANVTKKYGIRYWEIGNENYGNWEINLHKNKTPAAYANNALAFIKAMKAVDPTIQVGLPITITPPGQQSANAAWNDTVLKIAGPKANFVIVHWYPFNTPGTNQQTLDSTSWIAPALDAVKKQIQQDCGKNASHIKIMVTETNSAANGINSQSTSIVNAMFLADTFTTFLEQGATNIDWWDLYNDGSPQAGDYGVLQDTTDQPYPTFYALEMLNLFAKPYNELVQTTSSAKSVRVHAVKRSNGSVAVLLLNENPKRTENVTVKIPGMGPAATVAKTYTYDAVKPFKIVGATAGVKADTVTQALPPYSITVITLPPASH